MIRPRLVPIALCVLAASVLTACDRSKPLTISSLDDWMPGKPKPEDRWKPATAITDPAKIYAMNCLGCHSLGATTSPSLALDNPIYLAVISRDTLVNIITNGVPGTSMPAFLEAHGGSLSESQVGLLADYILSKKKPIDGPVPAYSAPAGDAAAGQAAFATYLAPFPGMTGPGSLIDPAFLGLVSDQYLRSLVIAGRPELGLPDYRSRVPGKAMSDQEIADVVAWLVSNRKNEFGQPLIPTNP